MEGKSVGAVVALSRGRRVVRAALCIALLGFPVFLLALAVRQEFEPVLAIDEAVSIWATERTQSWGLASVLTFLQAVSHPAVVYVAATLVAVWAGVAKGLRGRAIWAFSTMMVAWIVGEVLKLIVQRVRPVLDLPLTSPPGYAFPSGHALNITVAASVMLLLLWPLLSGSRRVLAVALAALVVLAVGTDRIFLGVHFVSDVVAGLVLGWCITFSSWIGFVGPTGATSSSESWVRR